MMTSTTLSRTLLSIFLASALAIAGCESGGSSNDSGSASTATTTTNPFVGGWHITSTSTAGLAWYLYIYSDSSFRLCDTADSSTPHLAGTYSLSGNTLVGSLTNPGVGIADVSATVSGSSISLTTIEKWYSPMQTNVFTGTKL